VTRLLKFLARTIRLRPICLPALTTIMPTLALADIEPTCEELWFSRNAMLNDAGYCFSSPLGRSLFDNSDCTTQSPEVSPEVAVQFSRIQALELDAPYVSDGMCRVDTNQTGLSDVRHLDLRKSLAFQPSTDGSSSACIGYRGEPISLRTAPDDAAEVLGQIPIGATVSYSHLPWEGWNFAIAWPTEESGLSTVMGWYRGDILEDAAEAGVSANCAFIAG